MLFRVFYYDKDFFGNSDFFEQYAYASSEETAKRYAQKCIKALQSESRRDFSFRAERDTDVEMLCVEQDWIDRENGVFRVTRIYGAQQNRDTEQIMDAKALKAQIMRLFEKDKKVWEEQEDGYGNIQLLDAGQFPAYRH